MNEVIPLSVKVTGGSSITNRVVDGITLAYTVGDIPIAEISIHEVPATKSNKTETETRRVLVNAEAEKMKEFQDQAFKGEGSDATLEISPFGHTFSGNVLGPNRMVYHNYYTNGASLIHDLEKVNSFVPHIYSLAYNANRDEQEFGDKTYTNVFAMIKDLLIKRQSDFEQMFEAAQFIDAASKESIQQIHNRNKEIFPTIERILDDSVQKGGDTYTSLAKLQGNHLRFLNNSIFNSIKNTLFNINQQFLLALIQLGDEFQSFFVPPIIGDSEYGYFKSNREKVGDTIAKSLNITGTSFSSTKMDRLPVQQVIVSGPPPKLHRAIKTSSTEVNNKFSFLGDNTTYAVYPKNPLKINGNNMPVSIPGWLPSELYTGAAYIKGDTSRDLGLEKRRNERNNIVDKVRVGLLDPIEEIVSEFAETTYKNVALASYGVTLQTFLDFSLLPGRRYEISDEDGKELFSGFLQGVQHKISGLSSSLSATTSLMFYAVTFTSFQLPE